MGRRFVEVPADELLAEFRQIGAKVCEAGGQFVEGRQGREVVVDVVPPRSRAQVRVYTSLAVGADAVRNCGEDAVRILVCARDGEEVKPLAESVKVLRTAPRQGDRVALFLERLRDQVRTAYLEAAAVPPCPTCEKPMVRRNGIRGDFYGCQGYPACRGTRPGRKVWAATPEQRGWWGGNTYIFPSAGKNVGILVQHVRGRGSRGDGRAGVGEDHRHSTARPAVPIAWRIYW